MNRKIVQVGVDTGKTNTNAVVLSNGNIIGWSRQVTSDDVTSGILKAVSSALNSVKNDIHGQPGFSQKLQVQRINIGTSHFLNALQKQRNLVKVAIIRLCGLASQALPPFSVFPEKLFLKIGGPVFMVDGGYYCGGKKEIASLNKEQIKDCITKIRNQHICNIVVSGIYSPVNNSHEIQVRRWINELFPEASVTLSHDMPDLGILLRENTSVLNETLKPLSRTTVHALKEAFSQLNLTCPIFLTQNDGSLLNEDIAKEFPVLTIASGMANSMRGAAFLTGLNDAIVVDIGGTSTEVGILRSGFSQLVHSKMKIADVLTSFHSPDTISICLGGGSHIKITDNVESEILILPENVASKLQQESIVCGGKTLTATDIAVELGRGNLGQKETLLQNASIIATDDKIHQMIEDVIDRVNVKHTAIPVILVGGGSILLNTDRKLPGASEVVRPIYYEVANAVGAASSQLPTNSSLNIHAGLEDNNEQSRLSLTGNVSPTELPIPISEKSDDQTEVDVSPMTSALSDICTGNDSINVDPKTGELYLNPKDIEYLAIGAGILGCGGGGNAYYLKHYAIRELKNGNKIRVINAKRYFTQAAKGEFGMSCAYMGASTTVGEMLFCHQQNQAAVKSINELSHLSANKEEGGNITGFGKVIKEEGISYFADFKSQLDILKISDQKLTSLFALEVGGSNCMTPLVLGAQMNLPVLDCDLMGRAFPKLQMCTNYIYGVVPYPAAVADVMGKAHICLTGESPTHVENHFRKICVENGSLVSFAGQPLTPSDILIKTVLHSTSRAWSLGKAVFQARDKKSCPILSVLEFENGKLICTGKIRDVCKETIGGFSHGKLIVHGNGSYRSQTFIITFQNENLLAEKLNEDGSETVVASVPDLISLVELETAEPIPTDELRHGLRIAVLALPAPPLLRTPVALNVVGPAAFGYKHVSYKPVGEFFDCASVIPE